MRLAALLLCALVLAGCTASNHPPAGGSYTGSVVSSSTVSTEPEPDSAVLQVTFDSEAPATLEVPFPHLDMCMSPELWMSGTQGNNGATAALVEDARGKVVSVSGQGSITWSVQVNTTKQPTCETFRYDPWSIDPDPASGTVEVRQGDSVVSSASVLVRWVRGGCGEATLYEGTPSGTGWTALEGRSVPAGDCPT